jgi:hypothetical protein
MDYPTIIDKFTKLQGMIKELNSKLAEISGELDYTLSELDKEQFISTQVRTLFKSRNIKFTSGSREDYLNAIRIKAVTTKWRPKTVKDFLSQFNQIYDAPEKIVEKEKTVELKVDSQKQQMRRIINEKKLRRLLSRYGITLENDFRRCTILDLVKQKALAQKWRPDTISKNVEAIIKAIDKNPLVTLLPQDDEDDLDFQPIQVHLTTEDYGLHMEGSKFD